MNLVNIILKAEPIFYMCFCTLRFHRQSDGRTTCVVPLCPYQLQRMLFLLLFPLRAGLEKSSRKTGSQITRRPSEYSFLLEQITLLLIEPVIPSETSCSSFYFKFTYEVIFILKLYEGHDQVLCRCLCVSKHQCQGSF